MGKKEMKFILITLLFLTCCSNNIKFSFGQKLQVINGLYKGCIVRVLDIKYNPFMKYHVVLESCPTVKQVYGTIDLNENELRESEEK